MASTNLPFVSSNIPPDLRQFLERVRETLSGDTFVRRVDYLGGTVPRNPGEPPGPGPNPIPLPCGTPVTPTTPTGFQVFPGFSGFLLQWDMPEYCGHDRTEVYGLRHDGVSDDLTVKNMLGESKGVLYSHVVQRPGDYWCFWIKHVNVNDVEGPFVAASKCGTTALDPGVILNTLKKQISESELYDELGKRINRMDLTGTGLIKENELRRTEILDLAQQVSEISVISGNRVFMSAVGSPPEEGHVCQFNGAIITKNKYTNTDITSQITCEEAGGVWGYYGFKHGDLWYQRSGWADPSGATESVTRLTWDAQLETPAWSNSATRTIYKNPKMPSVGSQGDLWCDTSSTAKVKWHYSDGAAWQFIIDYFVNIVADSRIIDFSQARVGACIDKSDPSHYVLSEEITRSTCEAQSNHVWEPDYPIATTIKQVGVSLPAHCLINGKINSDYNSSTCADAGGTWVASPTTIGLEQQMQAQQGVNGDLYAQYSVKIDNNGFVSGFGLSSETKNGVPFSQFLIRADRFAIANPNHTGVPVLDITVSSGSLFALRTEAAYPHGLQNGDLFTLQGVSSTKEIWNGTHTVGNVTSTTRFTFTVTGETTAPNASAATLSKVSIPLVVKTTAETLYGPLEVALSVANCSAMTTTSANRVKINNTAGTELFNSTFTVPNNSPTPTQVASVLSTFLSSYMTVMLDPSTGGVYLRNKSPETLDLGYIKISWLSGAEYVEANRPVRMTIPEGVYISDAFINNATINWAQINMATIDWLNVVRQLKANSILAGNIGVGECIQSLNFATGSAGWKICSDGVSEFGQATIRGDIYGGTATGLTGAGLGTGYYLGSNGSARFGDADGSAGAQFRTTTANVRIVVPSGGTPTTVLYFGPTPAGCYIKSVDYVANTSGWSITGSGDAEFNGGKFRGLLQSDTFNGTITGDTITAPGTAGWAFDRAGNGVLGTLHLRNGSVSDHQYTEARATSGLNGTSEWVSGANYSVGAIVWDVTTRHQYFCIANVTGGTTAPLSDTTHWMVYNDDPTISSITKWSSSTTYARGAKVWYAGSTYSGLYLSKSSSNTNHAPTNTQNGTYWLRYEHAPDIVSLPINITDVGTGLGTMVSARFLVYFESDLSGASPPERVVTNADNSSRPDIYAQLILYGSDGTRTVLAEAGYVIPCVGKKYTGNNHVFSATITDFTQIEGDASGTLALNIGNYAGFSSIPIYIQGTAMLATGAKR